MRWKRVQVGGTIPWIHAEARASALCVPYTFERSMDESCAGGSGESWTGGSWESHVLMGESCMDWVKKYLEGRRI